jgi:HTH-type transcriptional regulator/antitoxin HigA
VDTYLDLIHRFPLKPIKDDDEHEQAVEIIQELIGRKLDAGAGNYLDTLILLVNKYEDENHTPLGTNLSPQEALHAIMRANGMSQAEMGKVIGSESAVSMFLKGERGLSKSHIKALVKRFRVDASLFL